MEAINLIEKFQDRKEEFLSKLENKYYFTKNNDTNKKFEVGQIIEFYGGMNNDILYRSEILGFDKNDSDIYVLWDCYWFPIKDTEIRQIKIIK